jgi:hypothetical protein
MATYDCTLTLKVQGKPDQAVTCTCPDEACFLDCQDAFLACGEKMVAFRRTNPTDAATQPAPAGKKASVSVVALRDGKPHLDDTTNYTSLSDAAIANMENLFATFTGCPPMKKAKAKKK